MKKIVLPVLMLLSAVSLAADRSPSAGQDLRSIKSLSPREIESLRAGRGMGFAKPAELNHYPGPRHVLDLAEELELTPSQVAQTEALFEKMRRNAITLGKALLAAEAALDRDFQRGASSPESLQSALLEIGRIRARLRYVHLEAHLQQARLLTAEQVATYDELRGYRGKQP